ncbi:MAG: glycosyltransferase family 4 protein [Promethearchaeota archaeon]
MKIVYFVNYFPPLTGAAAINSKKISDHLVKLGHEVLVLAPYDMGKIFNIKSSVGQIKFPGIEVEFSSSLIKFPFSLIFSHVENMIKFLRRIRRYFFPDIILSQHHAFHFASVVSGYLSKRLKIPHVIRSHDIFLDLESRSFLYNLFVSLVHPQVFRSLPKSEICYLSTTEMKDYYLKFKKLRDVNFKVFPNGIDTNEFYPYTNQEDLKNEYGGDTILSFIGLMSLDIGIQNFIKIFPEILKSHKDTHLVLIGDGPYKNNLLSLIKNLNLNKHIHFLGIKPHEEIPYYMNNSDIGIGRITHKRQWKYMIPVKCLEYMACKKPFISTPISQDILKENDVGILLKKNFTKEELVNKLTNLIDDKNFRMKLGSNGLRKINENFQWEKLMKNFNENINKIIISK